MGKAEECAGTDDGKSRRKGAERGWGVKDQQNQLWAFFRDPLGMGKS